MKGIYELRGPPDGIAFHGEQCGSCVGIYHLSAAGGSYQLHYPSALSYN
jgi:hypothetical protein